MFPPSTAEKHRRMRNEARSYDRWAPFTAQQSLSWYQDVCDGCRAIFMLLSRLLLGAFYYANNTNILGMSYK
jgi:hypothetical protein